MAHEFRSFGRGVLLAVDVLAALAACVVVVVVYVAPRALGDYDADARTLALAFGGNPVVELVFAAALPLLAVNALYFLYGRSPARPLAFVPSEAPGGVVKISREALESGLRRAGERPDLGGRLRVAGEHGGLKRIVIRAHFQAPEGASIQEASRELRTALTSRLAEMVRATEGMRADLDIEFIGFSGKLAKGREPSLEAEAPPFTGPRYPLPDDAVTRGDDGR